MWTILVIVRSVLAAEMVKMRGAEDDKVFEAFLPDGLNKAFNERVQVRRAESGFATSDAISFQCCVKRARELRVPVMLHIPHMQASATGFFHEGIGLFNNPGFIRM